MKVRSEETESGLLRKVGALRADLLTREPLSLAKNTGAEYRNGRFYLDIWAKPVSLAVDDFVAIDLEDNTPCDGLTQAMLAYYFHTSDGAPVSGEWIAFSELPHGQFYAAAFQGYTGNKLAALFGDNIDSFKQAAVMINGRAQIFGDAAFYFQALPRVPVAAVCWLGDEDFPTSFRLLFDDSIRHHLPTDGCAILGSMLVRKFASAKMQIG
jgi:hypothetical protein